MPGNEILKKEWCNLVFKGRNTQYGAYKLRKETGMRYSRALICLGIITLAIATPLIISIIIFNPQHGIYDPTQKIVHFEGVRIKEARPQRRPEKKSEPEMNEKTDADAKDIEPEIDMLAVKQDEDVDPEKIVDLSKDSLSVLLKEQSLDLAMHEERTDGVVIDSIPLYPGGISSFMKWLDSTMVYPPACIRQKIEGTVVVAFIVAADGSTKDPHIIQGAHRQLNNEALRVIHLMRQWKPAKKYGRPIRAQVTLPIVFSLD